MSAPCRALPPTAEPRCTLRARSDRRVCPSVRGCDRHRPRALGRDQRPGSGPTRPGRAVLLALRGCGKLADAGATLGAMKPCSTCRCSRCATRRMIPDHSRCGSQRRRTMSRRCCGSSPQGRATWLWPPPPVPSLPTPIRLRRSSPSSAAAAWAWSNWAEAHCASRRGPGACPSSRPWDLSTARQPRARFAAVEAAARRDGQAMAFAEPTPVGLDRLEAWLATLPAKGMELVPPSRLLDPGNAAQTTAGP